MTRRIWKFFYKNRNQYRASIKNVSVFKSYKKVFKQKKLLQINKKITINEMPLSANTLVAYNVYFFLLFFISFSKAHFRLLSTSLLTLKCCTLCFAALFNFPFAQAIISLVTLTDIMSPFYKTISKSFSALSNIL